MKIALYNEGYFYNSRFGRGDPIRTGDLTVPNRARYQLRHAPTYLEL